MSDETAVQTDAQTVDATGQADNGEQNSGAGAQAAITFKSEAEFQKRVDAILKDRLERENRKADERAKKMAAEAEAKALQEQGNYKALAEKREAELAQKQAELEAERADRRKSDLAVMKRDVADKYKLPPRLADRLRGETLEDIEADAAALLADLPKPAAPNINASAAAAPGKTLPAGLTEASIRDQAVRLGVPYEAYKTALLNGK